MAHDPLDPFGWAPGRAGLFLDFDGVLADITTDRDGAVLRAGVPDLLVALSRRLGRVAIISGRPVGYLAEMIPDEVDVVGLYGLEWRSRGVHHTLHEAENWRGPVRELVALATNAFGSSAVEAKGLSLTIHYRNDPELAGSIKTWVAEQAERTGIESRPAKRSFELHPPIKRDKGTALVELAEDLDPVAYVGDDLGDLPAFDGLDRLSEHGVATIRVAVRSAEVPPILLSRADLVVDGPAGAEELLGRILVAAGSAPG